MFDRAVVNDAGVKGTGEATSYLGWLGKFQQTGKIPNYALGDRHRRRRDRDRRVRLQGVAKGRDALGLLAHGDPRSCRSSLRPCWSSSPTIARTSCAGSASPSSARRCSCISVYIFFAYEVDRGGGYQFFIRYDWLENVAFLGPHGISLAFGVDGIAAPMVLLTGMVAFGGALISWKIEHHNKDFFILFWVLVAGVYGTFVSLDLFFFFFFYEVAVLPMYLLIAVWGSSSVFETFSRTRNTAR